MIGANPVRLGILLALAEEPRWGYAIQARLVEVTSGALQPESGSIYMALRDLRAAGLVRPCAPSEKGVDARRRYYALTGEGRLTANNAIPILSGYLEMARRGLNS